LSWRAGREAASHRVYFGTDEQATTLVDTVTQGTYDVGSLNLGSTYYWRIDEGNEAEIPSVWEGDVWSFSTKEYIAIDDMDSYTDEQPNRLFDVWIDGYDITSNGSQVGHDDVPYAEKTIRHGGKQSMPFYYDNTGGLANSEIERTFTTAQDWSVNGADTLSLYYRGEPVAFLETLPGNILMSGVGLDIYQLTDQFRYAYKQLTGNGSITARIDSIQHTHDWAKAGVMIRASLETGAMQAHMIGAPSGRVEWMPRLTAQTNAAGTATAVGATPMPQWVRITRDGNTFTGEYSADGETWAMVPNTTPATIEMPNTVYVGLVVSSHLADIACAVQFSSVSTTGTVAGGWQLAAVGVDQPAGNGLDTFYITVEDSTGKKKTVDNPDPYAVAASDWQQWKILLSDLTAAGVSVNSVEKLYLGVGDKTKPSQNAAGVLYIDDIAFGHPLADE
jgi:regulation of enolase protein 1 (concanavalin A-like superfamily)